MSGPVPNRWLNCPRKASQLLVGKFMAFKTPLNSGFDDLVPPECRFPPKMLFDLCKTKKIKFGLWIDLTNTKRFYNKKEVEDENCKYVKLQCRGHGETPSVEHTNTFIKLVANFISQHPLEAIAVHCTHGFNRTGFLLVSYLVEKMDFSLDVAIQMFADIRPPGIYKSDYLQDLYAKYDDINDAPPAPTLPGWCHENDQPTNGRLPINFIDEPPSTSSAANLDYHGDNEPRAKRFKGNSNNKPAVFMEGVPGVEIFTEEPTAYYLQKKVQTMCEWRTKGFPGCQPVSMDVNNMTLLGTKPYRVSWKADGMRYMMLIDGFDKVYFFDRDHNVFKVNGLTFPYRKDLKRHLTDTLLDGEMVIDKVEGEEIPRYLAYDIIKFQGQDVGKMPFAPTRLQCLENEIIKPRCMAMEQGIINKVSEPFSVRKKDFWEITQAANLLGEKFARNLSHEPDGLIFQPAKDPYVAGRCDHVLKWKPLDMNSVDFRLIIAKESGEGIVTRKIANLHVGQLNTPFARMKYTKALKDLNNKIIECTFENNQWKFMRERTDKSYPNSYNTAVAVYGSITNPIPKEKLLDYIEHCKYNEDSEIMPPPTSARTIRR